MAEETEDIEEIAGSGGGKGKIIVIALVVLALGGGGAYFMLGAKGEEKEKKAKKVDVNKMGPVLPMEGFIVNLDEPSGARYLKISVSFELEEALTPEQTPLAPRLRDAVIIYLSSLRVAEVKKREVKEEMHKKLVALANTVYGKGAIRKAYFNEFVIQ